MNHGYLEDQRPGSDQIREPSALIVVEKGMDPRQRCSHGTSKALRRGDSQVGRFLRSRLVEGFSTDGVRESRQRASPVHFALSALSLELVENTSQLADLAFIELELVSEESKRPPDSKTAESVAAAEPVGDAGTLAVGPRSVRAAVMMTGAAATRITRMTTTAGVCTPPRNHCWMHVQSSFRRGHELPAGLCPWAPRLTGCFEDKGHGRVVN